MPFEPIHDAHAIEQVALVLQVANPLNPEQLRGAQQAMAAFKDELPGSNELQMLAFRFGPGPAPMFPTIGGRVLTKSRVDGTVENELRLEGTAITFRSTAYTRWDSVWDQCRRYFDASAPYYLAQQGIAAVALSYLDKFYWLGDLPEVDVASVLRERSPYVCSHVFGRSDLWHSYTGAFARIDDHIKRLINVNIDCVDENLRDGSRRVIAITNTLTDMLNQPGYTARNVQGQEALALFSELTHRLHGDIKRTFAEIINDDACNRVGLFS